MSLATIENGLVFAKDHKRTAVEARGLALLTLSFQTLGIIYSDIGTSPLYVLNGIWPASGPVPSKEDIIGGISAIIWSLTLLPLIKYVFICLYFGTSEGEGGTYALFQGLFPPEEKDFDEDRTLTGDSFRKSDIDNRAKLSTRYWWPLLIVSLFGTSLTLADGVFTPAVSVTSAVAGIAIAKPSVSHDVTGISIAFLVMLFLFQFRGTSFVAFIFAPITFAWLILLAATGIVNITNFPGIFRAFDPSRAVMLFVRTRDYDLLAGILLAVTGCEALFANLGQFNRRSIQISFGLFVYPSLVLAYLGQGARLIVDGEDILPNIFYTSIPGRQNGPLYWIMYIFAILATLIASQAMITATFSLVQQLVNMRNLPALRMVYTSERVQGQIYIPTINWILMAIVIIVVAAFKSSTALTNAYGFAVATVMITTTVLIAMQMRYVKRLPIVLAIGFFLVFGFFDGLFWGAALRKIPHGAWVPLMIGIIILSAILFWTWAKRLETHFDGSTRQNLRHIIFQKENEAMFRLGTAPDNNSSPEKHGERLEQLNVQEYDSESTETSDTRPPTYYISDRHHFDEKNAAESDNAIPLQRIASCAIFHKLSHGRGVPHSFISFIRQWPALPRVVLFLSIRVLNVPRIEASERYSVTKVRSIQGFYGVTYCLGFRDHFDVRVNEIIECICALEANINPIASQAIIRDIRSVSDHYTHIVPYYMIKSKSMRRGMAGAAVEWVRKFLLESVYYRISTVFPESVNWLSSDTEEIIHIGVNANL